MLNTGSQQKNCSCSAKFPFPCSDFGHIETIPKCLFCCIISFQFRFCEYKYKQFSRSLFLLFDIQEMTMSLTPTFAPSISLSSSSNSRATNAVRVPPNKVSVRSSKAEGPLRRPSAPIKEAIPPMRPIPPSPPSSDSPPPPPPSLPATPSAGSKLTAPTVTLEYQRQRAKELQEYFREKKAEDQANEGLVFGFTRKNEISNGRWAMFGFAVGLLTEYATGSDFVDQLKIIISNLGIADLD